MAPHRVAVPLVAALLACGASADAAPVGSLCEASAARLVECPQGAGAAADPAGCLLVADNEIEDRLFLHPVRADATLGGGRAIPLVAEDGGAKRAKVGDVESLEVADGVVWAVGSHGRRKWSDARAAGDAKQCGVDGARLAIFRGAWKPQTPMDAIRGVRIKTKKKAWQTLLGAECETRLFRLAADDAKGRALAAAACSEIAARHARAAHDRDACESAFQIEGAVALASAAGARRLWLGLRTPAVAGKAALLRLADGEALAFDGIALADLGGGRGVRDLARTNGTLWAIAGPGADTAAGAFELMSAPVGPLESGAVLAMEPVAALPASSEGLAVSPRGDRILVVTDGRAPAHEGGRCEVASEIFSVSPAARR